MKLQSVGRDVGSELVSLIFSMEHRACWPVNGAAGGRGRGGAGVAMVGPLVVLQHFNAKPVFQGQT